MGNRAHIIFDDGESNALPCVYLHWNGGPESVYTFLAYTKSVCREGDAEYIPARFMQIVGNYLGSNLSLGLHAVTRDEIVKMSQVGDNGAYVVNVNTYEVTARWFENYIDLPDAPKGGGYTEGLHFRRAFTSLSGDDIAKEKAEALAHEYSTRHGGMLKAIALVNDPFFKKAHDEEVVVRIKKPRKARAPKKAVA